MSNDTYELFDAADYVTSVDDAALMLQTALEDSAADPSALPTALGIIARSGNMSELARRVGMSRDGLYRALSESGNPTWSTILKVVTALGLRLEVHREPAA
ncbi:MAG: putative addiction module antidote protein [Acidipropionibacterium sp.]|jgi:probable addiction module antidote protein|nr:putative addiction module antidote protein [Acidipropionibacterium sp.]